MANVNRRWLILTIGLAIATFIIGLLIGLYGPQKDESDSESAVVLNKLTREAEPLVSERLINEMNADNIDKHLSVLCKEPHLAGTTLAANTRTTEYVRDQWIEQGYDVHLAPYDVLLSYPSENHMNKASLLRSDGSTEFVTSSGEKDYPEENHPDVVQPYNAFSPSGTVEAELVYANYGRDVDFENLTRQGVDVTGKIVIARYGRIFRGNKVLFAHQYGAIGVILFMDPKDYTDGDTTYPDSIWLPPTGVQRGNIVMIKGDQATPGYPANWYTARLTQAELDAKLPQIPCHPIGYQDAYMLLREMEGISAPSDWQGGLNITYKLGGTMKANKKVKLEVKNELKTVTIHNVIATMKGNIESDQVVLVGNHRDAWVYGGTDPSSGSAALLEMSRVYAQEVKNGWEPRRTIMFCSWDAEEFGLVGSYEWVEDNVKWLDRQAVAYLNIDSLTSGNHTFALATTPTLKQAGYRAAKRVPHPEFEGKTMYDIWNERYPGTDGKPHVRNPGAGTDFVPFEEDVGIATADIRYFRILIGDKVYSSGYPTYHTLYDGYRFTKMMDPTMERTRAGAAFLLELARDIIDSPILPFDVRDYAAAVDIFVNILLDKEKERFSANGISTKGLESASQNFTASANSFHDKLAKVDTKNPIAVRAVNGKLLSLEKAFLIYAGLPSRKEYKHVLLSPSSSNYYRTTTFPGMTDLLYQIEKNPERWEEVKKHLSAITFCIQSAAQILDTLF